MSQFRGGLLDHWAMIGTLLFDGISFSERLLDPTAKLGRITVIMLP
jgi:hypothetical protein